MKDCTSKRRKLQLKKRNQEKNSGLHSSSKSMHRAYCIIIIIQQIHSQFLISKMRILIIYSLENCLISPLKMLNRKPEGVEAHNRKNKGSILKLTKIKISQMKQAITVCVYQDHINLNV